MKIYIQNEQHEPLRGSITSYDVNGAVNGVLDILPGGSDVSADFADNGDYFRISAPGYGWYGAEILSDETSFTLVKKAPVWLYLVVAGIGGVVIGKYLKLQ